MRVVFLCVLLFMGEKLMALDLYKFQWNDFEGKLGAITIRLSLYREEDNRLTGNYCYNKYDSRIRLSGFLKGDSVILTEWNGSQVNGFFRGKLVTDSVDHFKGLWIPASGAAPTQFDVHYTSAVYGAPDKRYGDLRATDLQLEAFAKKVKSAIARSDKQWLASQVSYPFRTSIEGSKAVTLKTKADFIARFDAIFYPAYKERVLRQCACNLFANYRGVMLGNGEIWFTEKAGSTKEKPSFVVSAFNN